jgi:hypothetical protein
MTSPPQVIPDDVIALEQVSFVEIVDVPESCIIYRSGHLKKCRYRVDL